MYDEWRKIHGLYDALQHASTHRQWDERTIGQGVARNCNIGNGLYIANMLNYINPYGFSTTRIRNQYHWLISGSCRRHYMQNLLCCRVMTTNKN
ncbi:unnamed protein product [Amoebophrya sp. A25]|nr:unnamed protein product [Amoebophrya sp. A25]|eukprot:GSA25T00012791001.1